ERHHGGRVPPLKKRMAKSIAEVVGGGQVPSEKKMAKSIRECLVAAALGGVKGDTPPPPQSVRWWHSAEKGDTTEDKFLA
ncbi:MAG: hypothetical protein ACRC92_10560, partial [Peptostreptococcaceae bacterium]